MDYQEAGGLSKMTTTSSGQMDAYGELPVEKPVATLLSLPEERVDYPPTEKLLVRDSIRKHVPVVCVPVDPTMASDMSDSASASFSFGKASDIDDNSKTVRRVCP